MKFLIFGKIPPPVGGVTISVQNLTTALTALKFKNERFNASHLLAFKQFDIGHIHYSRKLKVILGILLSKILCKKTIVTKHGAGFYPQNNLLDKLILAWSDGLIVLNQEVFDRASSKKNLIKLPPIFQEGIEKNNNQTRSYLEKESNTQYLLLYAGGAVYIDNQEVYGIYFTLKLIEKLPKNVKLILLDPTGAYAEEVKKYDVKKLIYFNSYLDFNRLVQEVDLYLRPTSSDGNSIATLEALSQGTAVLASDVVEREENIDTYPYGDEEAFLLKIHQLLDKTQTNKTKFTLKSIQEYLEFCRNL